MDLKLPIGQSNGPLDNIELPKINGADISAAVDGYLQSDPAADAARKGNVMARMRMIALFDLSAKHRAIPLGTGNKTERLFGYFTWHADDAPPINPPSISGCASSSAALAAFMLPP